MKKILVTGSAGFIGYHYARRLCEAGYRVLGVDNLNPYYAVSLKEDRLKQLETADNFSFRKGALEDRAFMEDVFASGKPDIVVNLAAQAGVRYSIENPHAYVDSNVVGFMNVLEECRHHNVEHLIYASSSSVYGANRTLPFSVSHNVDHPVSLYAATKKANELMAHTYASLYNLPCTGLRFFTVYGPWGRPDMAIFRFADAMMAGRPLDVYNNGEMFRDFTYVDDVIESMIRLIDKTPVGDPAWDGAHPDPSYSYAPYRLYNIGNSQPEKLMDFVRVLEDEMGKKAQINFMPMQAGDVLATSADTSALERDIGFKPTTPLREGIRKFVTWYKGYYGY